MRQALDKAKLKTIYDHVAVRYDVQHSLFTAHADQRGRVLLVDKAVAPGDWVLDCGAGTGSAGLLVAQKVGESGRVILFDASEGMLAIAKKKSMQSRVLDRVEFEVGDMLDLPFADNIFDAVLSTYSMCTVYNPLKAIKEVYRVTKPGGYIGVAHSTEPKNSFVKWLSDRVEEFVWHIPGISLGCRSVTVLPSLEQFGCRTVFTARIGVPLWPFFVFVVKKQES